MRQGALDDANVRRYCNNSRDEVGSLLSTNPLGTRSGRRHLRKALASEFLGTEMVSDVEMLSLYRRAIRVLKGEEEEVEEEEVVEEVEEEEVVVEEEEVVDGRLASRGEPETPSTPPPPTRRRQSGESSTSVSSSSLDTLRTTPRLTDTQRGRRRAALEGLSRERLIGVYRRAFIATTGREPVISAEVQSEELASSIMSMEDQLRALRAS